VALIEEGQPEPAVQHFQAVTALDSSPVGTIGREEAGYAAVAHLYLGAYEGRSTDAIKHYKRVLSLAQTLAAQNVYANLPRY
jgi:hypothetical protein